MGVPKVVSGLLVEGGTVHVDGLYLVDCVFRHCTVRGRPAWAERVIWDNTDMGYAGLNCVFTNVTSGAIQLNPPAGSGYAAEEEVDEPTVVG